MHEPVGDGDEALLSRDTTRADTGFLNRWGAKDYVYALYITSVKPEVCSGQGYAGP